MEVHHYFVIQCTPRRKGVCVLPWVVCVSISIKSETSAICLGEYLF